MSHRDIMILLLHTGVWLLACGALMFFIGEQIGEEQHQGGEPVGWAFLGGCILLIMALVLIVVSVQSLVPTLIMR